MIDPRHVALVLTLMLAPSCADDEAPAQDLARPDAAAACAPGGDCPSACAEDEVCAGSYGGFNRHAPACLKRCLVDTDCAADMRCADLFGEHLGSAVCISRNLPVACGVEPGWHCDLAFPSCKDATTLVRGFSQAENGTCGYEYLRCPTACVAASDAGSGAHCE